VIYTNQTNPIELNPSCEAASWVGTYSKIPQHVTGTESSLQFSQDTPIDFCPEPDQSSPSHPIPMSVLSILILSVIYKASLILLG
jgi:UDP-N-acetyl-D-mannosaminuronate dehydrogenase